MSIEEILKALSEEIIIDVSETRFPEWNEMDGAVIGKDLDAEDKQDAFYQGANWFKDEIIKRLNANKSK